MDNPTFIDGIGRIRLSGGMVRIDLLSESPERVGEDGEPAPHLVDQLVMSPEGFRRMFSTLAESVKQMEKDGIIVREGDKAANEDAAEAEEEAASSPNF